MSSASNPCPPHPAFVPYATPSISPRPTQRAHSTAKSAMAVAAAAAPFPIAPPSPPSPQLSHGSGSNPLAVFAAEMFVWLWFAPPGHKKDGGEGEGNGQSGGGIAKHQVRPTDRFMRFCHEVLTTTQVSHSVVLLSLLFISRLKQRNAINGAPGSEYRLAVTGLMLANKVLDDNTYTAQTWSQVSSLELQPLVAGEAEFLKGLDWSLHITKRDYDSWLKLLEGHVAARNMRLGKVASPSSGLIPSARRIASSKRARAAQADGALHGLGIEGASHLPVPQQEEEERRVRRRLDGSVSTNTTPKISFTSTFTIPAPATAPHPQPRSSAPLPSYGRPQTAGALTLPSVDVSPTSLAYTARRNAAARAVSASSGSSGVKRSADNAFSGDSVLAASALPPMFSAQGQMSRSYSAGPASSPAPSSAHLSTAPSFYIHPSHHVPILPLSLASSPHGSRPSSSSSATSYPAPSPFYPPPASAFPPAQARDFQTLSDAFSPRYDPEHYRRLQQGAVSLGFYSLAAGHTLGHLRQTLPSLNPLVPPLQATPYGVVQPSGMSTVSTSPVSEAYSHPYGHPLSQPHHALQQQHLHAYPTPSLPSYGPTASSMVPSLSSHGSYQLPLPSAPPLTTQSSPPRWSPTSTGPAAVAGAGYAAALPPYLQQAAFRPALHGPLPTQQQLEQQAGPHPFFSSYSNAGAPGVYWRAGAQPPPSSYPAPYYPLPPAAY
ncbi:hypothetical protein JCM11251_002123 [Rhodosporidiobolus azoricus]